MKLQVVLSVVLTFLAVNAFGGEAERVGKQIELADEMRVIHFPKDRSMGLVSIGELRTVDPHWWMGWEPVGEAKGDIRVPTNAVVRLDISTEASQDISPLATLKPDDIQALSFTWNRCYIDDNDLKHLTGLTGLKLLMLGSDQFKGSGLVHLAGMESLEALGITRMDISDEHLKHVAALKSLKRLDLSSTKVTDEGLVHLANLDSLECLTMDRTNISGEGFSTLVDAPIKTLRLAGSDVTDKGLKHIAKINSLESLLLMNTEISDNGIEHLIQLPTLKELNFYKVKLSNTALAHISKLASLESLDLPRGFTDADLSVLKEFTRLKRLDIGRAEMTGAGLDFLKDLKSLEYLQFPSGITDKDLEVLKELTSLEELWIQNSSISNKGLANLTHLKSLKTLLLHNGSLREEKICIATSTFLGYLSYLPINKLTLYNIKLDDARLSHLSELNQLEDLSLCQMPLYDEDLKYVGQLTNLKRLRFDSETVSHGGMAHLSNLTALEDFSPQIPMTDEGLSHLSKLQKLNRFQISGDVTEEGLEYIENLKSLQTLRIVSGNDFSDESQEKLCEALPMLQRLNIIKKKDMKSPPEVGTIPPNFTINTIENEEVTLKDYQGKTVLLYFWGTWCSPCVASTPGLKKLQEDLSEYENFKMISLSLDSDEFRLRKHIEKYKLEWPQIRLGLNSQVAADYGVKGVPSYFLIGPDGRIASVERNWDKLKATVKELHGERRKK